jgi:surface antigen
MAVAMRFGLGRALLAHRFAGAMLERDGRRRKDQLGGVALDASMLLFPKLWLAAGGALLAILAVVLVVVLIVLVMMLNSYGASASRQATNLASETAFADIPAGYLALYDEAVADRCPTYPAMLLAAIGKVETNHGRSTLPGVSSGQNFAGAAGPMQIGVGGAAGDTWGAFGVDGDGDGLVSVYDPADAIHTAAVIECAWWDKTPEGLPKAVFAYNHGPGAKPVAGDRYVSDVVGWYLRYSLTPRGGAAGVRGDDYPWKGAADGISDGHGYFEGECVSFVAHRLRQDGKQGTDLLGNAAGPGSSWQRRAKGESRTPHVGDVAHWAPNSGGAHDLGHVAYVAAVQPNGDVLVEEYNWRVHHGYGTRLLSPTSPDRPTSYLQF